MVAPATIPTDPVPPSCPQLGVPAELTTADTALLSTIFQNNLDLNSASHAANLPLPTLLDFVSRPDIQQRIETYRHFRLAATNDKILNHTADARIKAIHELQKLMESAEEPIERRRHARLILHYSTPLKLPPLLRLSGGGTSPLLLRLGGGGAEALRGGGGKTSPPQEPSQPHSSPSESPSLPAPTPPPTSDKPQDLINHFSSLLVAQQSKDPAARVQTLVSLHACLHPTATFNDAPASADAQTFISNFRSAVAETFLGDVIQSLDREVSAARFRNVYRLFIARRNRPRARADLILTREDIAAPWRIASIRTKFNSS